jgi:elongator complex protein 3
MGKGEAINFIIGRLIAGDTNLEQLKRKAGRTFGISAIIKNPDILEQFPEKKLTAQIRKLLLKKPSRTMSGVTPVAVMVKPQDSCKFGCVYCPFTGLAAKSYVGYEPAALRGRQYSFDPYKQTASRVEQFAGGGHTTDKCEIIVMGGTFLGMDKAYKHYFIKGIYEALNGQRAASMPDAIKSNETAEHRAVGLTIETRPDICVPYIDEMLSFGATRVELGVQHADDSIYELVNRGHTVKDVVDTTKALKDAAFKVCYHVMPGLPGSDPEKDISFIKRLFENPDFRPDMLKIYPTLVVPGTKLHQWEREGKYKPYSSEEAAETITEFYRHIPSYVRVMRIQRDIPAGKIGSGVKKSNLRELVEDRLREKDMLPQEIRYREVKGKEIDLDEFSIKRHEYDASGAKECFLSFEDQDTLLAGFLRLRLPQGTQTAFVRELHVYGSEAPINDEGKVQHQGIGSKLLKHSEEIARESGKDKMAIISGVGVREYYRKRGYSLEGPYLTAKL